MTDTTRFEQQEINDVVYLLRNADRPKEVDRLQRHAAAIINQLLTDNAALREELEQVKAERDAWENAHHDIGLYPAAMRGFGSADYEQRSDYQNGWNAAVKAFLEEYIAQMKALSNSEGKEA